MAPNRVITACPIIAPRRFGVYTLYESAVIATGIHRFCLIHPTLVFRPEQKCISRHRTLLGANAHSAVIKWSTCIPHSYGNDKYSFKAIPSIRGITTCHSPHTCERCPGGNRTSVLSLGRQGHPKNIVEDGSISSAINSSNPNPNQDMECPGPQHSWYTPTVSLAVRHTICDVSGERLQPGCVRAEPVMLSTLSYLARLAYVLSGKCR